MLIVAAQTAARALARTGRRGHAAVVLAAIVLSPRLHAEVQIERLFMPFDAAPSSFAIGLPGGVNFCFDPVRGAISYVWKGGFVDLSATRPGPGKFINAVKLLGPVVYQETGVAPLRRGDPGRPPVVEFSGYSLREDAVEFRYTVDGVPVREEVRASRDGSGLTRRFHLESGSDATWWHVVDGKPATELVRVAPGVLALELPFGKAAAP